MSGSSSPTYPTRQLSVPRNDDLTLETSPKDPNAIGSILSSRKCWRSMKGADEAVWPPDLEAALIEGLKQYKPTESKSGRPMGRFPMRNKFVSDFILQTTGKRRTPKQVGSRIQQLRDTDTGKPILKAISDRHYAMMHPNGTPRSSRSNTPSSSNNTPSPQLSTLPLSACKPNHVYIEVLPPYMGWQSPPSSIMSPADGGRTLSTIDPTIIFTSSRNTGCFSRFYVYKNGILIHQEIGVADVAPCEPDPVSAIPMYLHSASLVPQYWARLCDSEEPSSYVIHAEVVSATTGSAHASSDILYSTFYHFFATQTPTTPPLSPHSSDGGSEVDYTLISPEAFQQSCLNDTLFDEFSSLETQALAYAASVGDVQMKREWQTPSPVYHPAVQQPSPSGKTSHPLALDLSSGSPASLGSSAAGFDFDFHFDFEVSDYLDDFSYQ